MMTLADLTTLLKTAPTVPTLLSVWLDGDGSGAGYFCFSLIPPVFTLDRSALDGPDLLA
jgi:hypothetical protein